jgi:hypothetical protein
MGIFLLILMLCASVNIACAVLAGVKGAGRTAAWNAFFASGMLLTIAYLLSQR